MNKKRKLLGLILASLFIVSIGLSSCEYETIAPVTELPQNVSFSGDVIPIFNQSCNTTGCHNNGGIAPDLSEENAYTVLASGQLLNLASPSQSELYLRMTDVKNPMPLSGILSKSQTDKVLVWIQEGAVNN